ncbi:MAG: hypothetical protein H6627_08090 [Calditrichae bacterium]|nr:hypothetical protein [Calditrichota bacterium]MCB9058512.1 hypothetical protein [Calditrichia bacterium]
MYSKKILKYFRIFSLLFFLYPSLIFSQTDSLEIEIDGLIIDYTISNVGRDFFDNFYSVWEAPYGINDYNISISEKPLPNIGSIVSADVNDTPVFSKVVNPRGETIENAATEAAEIILDYLIKLNDAKSELDNEDLSGSGIY